MPVFRDAWHAMGRNLLWVGVYVVALSVCGTLFHVYSNWTRELVGDGPVPGHHAVLGLVVDLLYVAVLSAVVSIVFAEMGKEMDRPLWKCSGMREAIARYFVPWFLLGLTALAMMRLLIRAAEADQQTLVLLIEFSRMFLIMAYIPVGGCIMYHRGLEWSRLPVILAPLARLFSVTLGILLLGMFQWALQWTLFGALPEDARSSTLLLLLIDLPLYLLDCYMFCAVWHLCMLDRDTQISEDPGDYDF